jgi:sarcosine oxidase/L-pipecolate oxidase
MVSFLTLKPSLQHVKNRLERIPDQFTQLWKWRVIREGGYCNGIGEGESGSREMSKVEMAAGAI